MNEISRSVPPEGSLDSKIAFVGEAPAYNEVIQGRPFVGQSGQQFNDFLLHARILRKDVYITNLFKVQVSKRKKPREQFFSGDDMLFDSLKGFTEAGMEHVRELHEELKAGRFNVVVPMGNPALYSLLERTGITKWRGSVLWADTIDKKCIPAIHPAATLRQYLFKQFIVADFKKARVQGEFPDLRLKDRKYLLEPSFLDVESFLTSIKEKVAFDIEVLRGEVSCISFCSSPTFAIVIPFRLKGQPYFTLDQEAEVWSMIAKVLENEAVKKVGQNLTFDASFLYEKYGIVTKNIDDTMIAHRLTFPDYPAGLDFMTSMYTDIPYYKDEGKQYMKWGGTELNFLLYNAKDSIVCIETMPQLKEDMERLDNMEAYEVHTKLIEQIIYMGGRGLKVDVEGMLKEKVKAEEKFGELQEELNGIVGTELNPNSPKQVAAYFYVHKGLTPYKHGGSITTNDGAMKRIARKGFPEARIVLKMRHLRKLIGTYYEVKLKEGRLCCSYSPITGMGRLSSSADIFGYGTNLQNQPEDMDTFFLADEGHLIYNVDLSQADNRSVAYIAPEPRMIQAFEEKKDVHSLTGSLVFGIPVDEVIQMHKEKVKCELGYGDMTHREWGKRLNHALNFGMGPGLFSYMLEIPEKEGKVLVEAYHRAYPGVRQNYHRWVRDQLSKNRILYPYTMTKRSTRMLRSFVRYMIVLTSKYLFLLELRNTLEYSGISNERWRLQYLGRPMSLLFQQSLKLVHRLIRWLR
jgi:DNA polymerase I-like protein with 3'-5' exonuclease and polymerase domains/uracil-DNA glycosylase